MGMKAFRAPLSSLGAFEEVSDKMKNNRGMLYLTGCVDMQKLHFIDALGAKSRIRVIVAANDLRAREIYENMRFFDRNAVLFPAKDFIFFQADVHSRHLLAQRLAVYKMLATGQEGTIILPISAFMNHMMPFDAWKKASYVLAAGETADLEKEKKHLAHLGYERTSMVEGPGQFAVRGGILDIYPLTEELPVRVEFWGDEIDSIRSFDPESQRSVEALDGVIIYPAGELLPDEESLKKGVRKIEKEAKLQEDALRGAMKTEEAHRIALTVKESLEHLLEFEDISSMESYIDYFYPRPVSFLDYLPPETPVFIDEPGRVIEAAQAVETEFSESMKARLEKGYILPTQAGLLFDLADVTARFNSRCCIGMSMLDGGRGGFKINGRYMVDVHSLSPYNNSIEMLTKDLHKWKSSKSRVILVSGSRTRGERMAASFLDEGLNAFYSEDAEREVGPGEIMITHGHIDRGFEYPLIKFVVISDDDIFGKSQKKTRKRQRAYEGIKITSFSDLTPGDYVVHESHGLGIYRGIEKIESGHVIKDYMKVEYEGKSSLYIPATSLDVIQKYADADAKKPKLNRLGGQEWQKTRSRVQGAVREIARELVELYAARHNKTGFAYSPDTVWQREFEEMFPFEETEDQIKAIEDTKADMEGGGIMDRLVCGDVGYGKTEIALRAAFKAVQDGKQVAYLVPTTILAQQHYNTFCERLKEFPVRIDLLCRFKSSAEQKKTAADLKTGRVDIVIGTHRLLSSDIGFKDLGLLIVDEEQRFGVTHKEKIKMLKKDVDVLTLTATPIPRTLHMSLIGIRDMSVLEEPPQDRLPIQTYVMEYNEEMVREAISRELARNGQVYYVYNRVNTIMDMADRLQRLLPQARIAFAHGQMKERELENIMYDFIAGDIDVLVTTTIIETGLDIPNANTMIIHDADTMGLSQLYQLRGRIGRSNRTSYAFLMYKRDKVLREIAEKRLAAIREFTELGSGIKIAMRDLEIRGAGNLLGAEQHGHMEAVGYDLYCKLLGEAVKEAKGEKNGTDYAKDSLWDAFETTMDLDVDAYIPPGYIRNENQKLDIYKRIAEIEDEQGHDDMLDELLDRFGELPTAVQNLLKIALLKTQAHKDYLTEVVSKGDMIRFVFYEKAPADVAGFEPLIKKHRGRLSLRTDKQPTLVYQIPKRLGERDNSMDLVKEILGDIEAFLLPQAATPHR